MGSVTNYIGVRNSPFKCYTFKTSLIGTSNCYLIAKNELFLWGLFLLFLIYYSFRFVNFILCFLLKYKQYTQPFNIMYMSLTK